MDTLIAFILFTIGLIIIIKGGDIFLDGAIGLAKKTGISSAIIGATIVSIATTLPEMFVSSIASFEGLYDMSVGNALGSYICNIGFIIGISTLIKPVDIKFNFNVKGIMMIGILVMFLLFSIDGVIQKFEGLILMSFVFIFIFIYLREMKREEQKNNSVKSSNTITFNYITMFIFGGILIITGSHILIDSGVKIANVLNIPTRIISLTLIALGTSMPELITALASIFKKDQSVSIGNILGANILNISMILGTSSLISSEGLIISKQSILVDIPTALILASIFVFSGIYKKKISRITGLLLLSIYFIYINILL